MPLRLFECPVCGYQRESFKKEPKCNHNQEEEGTPVPLAAMKEVLVAPNAKFMEPRDPDAKERGKSVPKDFNKIVKERARSHARDNELHDLIQTNNDGQAIRNQWMNEKGQKRKKIDDL